MRGYRLSFLLGTLLIMAAFVVKYMGMKKSDLMMRDSSYALFIGGAIMVIVGWREYNERQGK